ncbi:MAG TPA: ribosome biogenesis factor YjgA [Burkholderiaceae bacterium]|nr:ribosome biogenesis factor YjgA [Burkholderiaceae bacterium]
MPAPPTTLDDEPAPAAPFSLDEKPSKTRRKQASHELQALGEAMAALPEARLAELEIADTLRDAVREFKRTKTFEARRRQMQYIGKLMRLHDIEPVRQAVADLQLGRARDALSLHQAERWRAELIADDDAATRFIAEHAGTDAQQLRSLVRAARKDAALVPEQRSGRAFRELFQFVKEHTGA